MIRFAGVLLITLLAATMLHAQETPPKLTASFDEASGTITVRDAQGETIQVFERYFYLYAEAFSPNWRYYVAADLDNFADLWDVWTGERLAELVMDDVNRVSEVAFNPDSTMVAVGGERGEVVRVFAIDALRQGNLEPVLSRQAVAGGAMSLTFSNDGTLLAATLYVTAESADFLVLLWDMETGEVLLEERLKGLGGSLQFSEADAQISIIVGGVEHRFEVPQRAP
jgi:WD40 repeat protein